MGIGVHRLQKRHGFNAKQTALWALFVIATVRTSLLFGYQLPSTNNDLHRSFEVVSIRPNHNGGGVSYQYYLTPGYVRLSNSSIMDYIAFAYNMQPYQIVGAPRWVTADRFDLWAKETESFTAKEKHLTSNQAIEEVRLMFRSMLADRCKLRVAYTVEKADAYVLTVAKGGPRLTTGIGINSGASSGNGYLKIQNSSVSELAKELTEVIGSPVIDESGIRGRYNMNLRWLRDEGSPDGYVPPMSQFGLVADALREQLGLDLRLKRVSIDAIRILKIEKPSPN